MRLYARGLCSPNSFDRTGVRSMSGSLALSQANINCVVSTQVGGRRSKFEIEGLELLASSEPEGRMAHGASLAFFVLELEGWST